jgi:hypothetical protein
VSSEAADLLAAEVQAYFDAGRVGLYEFLWILRSICPDTPEPQFKEIARTTLDRLLTDGVARLVWRRWADAEFEEPATRAEVDDTAWNNPTDRPYLAVVPVE